MEPESMLDFDDISDAKTISDFGSVMDMSSINEGTQSGGSAGSVFSFDTNRDEGLFLKSHGRTFNAKNPLYALPAGLFFIW